MTCPACERGDCACKAYQGVSPAPCETVHIVEAIEASAKGLAVDLVVGGHSEGASQWRELKNAVAADSRMDTATCYENRCEVSGVGLGTIRLRVTPLRAPAWIGPGIGPLLMEAQHKCDLQEDAERLAELRRELDAIPIREELPRQAALIAVIAVYHECQARGRTFGGLR